MTTYSIRCRNAVCRHRRVSHIHPGEYKVPPKCPSCGQCKGWRIEHREYNKRNLCNCNGPRGRDSEPFPHNTTHPLCDQHPRGYYNQAKRAGVNDEDLPLDVMPTRRMQNDEPCPF